MRFKFLQMMQPWLWINLVSCHLRACRCWFTGSDHTEVIRRKRSSSCLFDFTLFLFSLLALLIKCSSIPSLCKHTSSRYVSSIIMRVKDDVLCGCMCLHIHRKAHSAWSGLLNLNNRAKTKTQWVKNPNIDLYNIVCTARRLPINLLTSELSLVRLSWGWEQ